MRTSVPIWAVVDQSNLPLTVWTPVIGTPPGVSRATIRGSAVRLSGDQWDLHWVVEALDGSGNF